MNIKETKKAIEVMQAYIDGKDIIVRDRKSPGNTDRATDPAWDWWTSIYEVMPEQREIDIDEGAKIVVSIQHKGKYVETLVIDGPCHFVEKLDD